MNYRRHVILFLKIRNKELHTYLVTKWENTEQRVLKFNDVGMGPSFEG